MCSTCYFAIDEKNVTHVQIKGSNDALPPVMASCTGEDFFLSDCQMVSNATYPKWAPVLVPPPGAGAVTRQASKYVG